MDTTPDARRCPAPGIPVNCLPVRPSPLRPAPREPARQVTALPGRPATDLVRVPFMRPRRHAGYSLRLGGQCGGQPGQEDVEAAFEFGGAVVGGQDGGEAAQQREFADRQPVQAQPQQVVGLVRFLDEFLQLVEDVAVQEAEQGPVDVQGVGPAEPGAGSAAPGRLRAGAGCPAGGAPSGVASGPGDQQRHHAWVGQRQPPVIRGRRRAAARPSRGRRSRP